MPIISNISGGSGDAFARLVQGLQLEFGCADVDALAEQIFAAERLDFLWDARVSERYLGSISLSMAPMKVTSRGLRF